MSELLQAAAAYVPPHIIRQMLQTTPPTPPAEATSDCFAAAVLFADISGFTPLTELLARQGLEGPEELTRLLNNYFSHMIALIEAEGGEVVKFSGDALTALFLASSDSLNAAVCRARQTAEAMQSAMQALATLPTSVGQANLAMKIGIGAGEVLTAVVGGRLNRWEDVVAGDALRQAVEAEKQAQRGDVILSPAAAALTLPETVTAQPLSLPDWSDVVEPETALAALRCYVPSAVLTWLTEGLQEWVAVLRPMSILFISIGGLEYEEAGVVARLHHFLRAAQDVIYRHEGSINKLAVDDKGTLLLLLFGAPPYAHEDDPERALRCALALQSLADSQALQLSIGIATGRVFAGPVGSESRREYTVMGDTVNLAARLMSAAGPGQVYCDYETYRWSRHALAFDILSPISVKGKAGLIRVYRPTGEQAPADAQVSSRLVGRQTEMVRLTAALDTLRAGDERQLCLLIEGEAGIGKSRLVQELVQLMRERGIAGLLGRGRSIEQQTPYRAWRDIFTSYFALDDIDDIAQRQSQVKDQVGDIAPHLLERLPLLNDVLTLGLPENALTSALDSHLRHESLVSLLLWLLQAWSTERPLVLVLEDAHWLDSLSWDLALQVARSLAHSRTSLLLVVVMRPVEEGAAPAESLELARMPHTNYISLSTLQPEETVILAAARLGLDDALPEPVAELIRTRASGNPFFAEELVYALRDNGLITITSENGRSRCLVSGDLAQAAQSLPDTIQGIVLSRIDRLPPEEQLTLKVAAVIGRTFAYTTLYNTLGQYTEISERLLRTYLSNLVRLDLTPLEAPEPELTYIFKHIITQEVAYETLLFAQRRQLHRSVAFWYEERVTQTGVPSSAALDSPLAVYYPLLAYHWQHAGDDARERHYAWLAGQWAAAHFANVEAAAYFSQALALTPESDLAARCELLLAREAVNDMQGNREAQAQDLAALADLIDEFDDGKSRAEIALRQANYYEATSNYAAALTAVEHAVAQVAQIDDIVGEVNTYIAWGRILWRQGDYEAARTRLEHALARAQDIGYLAGKAKSRYDLGHVLLYQGNQAEAQAHYQCALAIYQAEGDRQGEANCLSVLGVIYEESGDYSAAGDHYHQALALYHAIGDRRGETYILGNLGVVYCDLGDYDAARQYHQQALELRLTIGDRYGEAVSLVNLGLVYHYLDNNQKARHYCQRALAIQQEIGDRRGQGYSLTYLGHALAALQDLEAAASAYQEAIHLRHELGHVGLTMDDLAGLARVALAQGNIDQASDHVIQIITWLETHGIEGIEYPLQVYLTCYQVLATTEAKIASSDRAGHLLHTAYTLLQQRAANISDKALQHTFLEGVKTNRAILKAWQQHPVSSPMHDSAG